MFWEIYYPYIYLFQMAREGR